MVDEHPYYATDFECLNFELIYCIYLYFKILYMLYIGGGNL